MPTAWRIVKARHAATAFSGEGASKTGGRWNSRGVAVVYASEHKSLAALETLVHIAASVRFRYKLFRLDFDDAVVERLPLSAWPGDWPSQPAGPATKRLGDAWAKDARSAVLAVPSLIIPDEINYVLNPAHPDFSKIVISKPTDFVFDSRLLK